MSVTSAAGDSKPLSGSDGRYECRICWYLYDPSDGDPLEQIPPGTAFSELPPHWRCPQCDAEQLVFLPASD